MDQKPHSPIVSYYKISVSSMAKDTRSVSLPTGSVRGEVEREKNKSMRVKSEEQIKVIYALSLLRVYFVMHIPNKPQQQLQHIFLNMLGNFSKYIQNTFFRKTSSYPPYVSRQT